MTPGTPIPFPPANLNSSGHSTKKQFEYYVAYRFEVGEESTSARLHRVNEAILTGGRSGNLTKSSSGEAGRRRRDRRWLRLRLLGLLRLRRLRPRLLVRREQERFAARIAAAAVVDLHMLLQAAG